MTEGTIQQIGITAGVLVFYFVTRFFITRFNKRYAVRNKIQKDRAVMISKIINFILSLLFAVGIALVWNFDWKNLFFHHSGYWLGCSVVYIKQCNVCIDTVFLLPISHWK